MPFRRGARGRTAASGTATQGTCVAVRFCPHTLVLLALAPAQVLRAHYLRPSGLAWIMFLRIRFSAVGAKPIWWKDIDLAAPGGHAAGLCQYQFALRSFVFGFGFSANAHHVVGDGANYH